jgi:hypothetical protein
VTGSENVNDTSDVCDAFKVPEADCDTDTVGAVASRVTGLDDGDVDDGPELPDRSRAPLAPNVGTIVPSEQPETVTVREAPLPDTANEQPVAVPEFEKSAGSTPVTGSENVMVYTTDADDDTDDADTNDVTLGPDASPRRRTPRHSDPFSVRTHCSTSLPVVTTRPMMMHSSPADLGVNDSGTDAFVGRHIKPFGVCVQRRLPDAPMTTRPSFRHESPDLNVPVAPPDGATGAGPESLDAPRHCNPRAVRVHCSTSSCVTTTRPSIRHVSPSLLGVNDSGTDAVVGRHRKPLAVRSQRRLPDDVTTTRPSFRHVSPARRPTNADTGDSTNVTPAVNITATNSTTRRDNESERFTRFLRLMAIESDAMV